MTPAGFGRRTLGQRDGRRDPARRLSQEDIMDSTKIIPFPAAGLAPLGLVMRRFEDFPRFARNFYDPPAAVPPSRGGLNDNHIK